METRSGRSGLLVDKSLADDKINRQIERGQQFWEWVRDCDKTEENYERLSDAIREWHSETQYILRNLYSDGGYFSPFPSDINSLPTWNWVPHPSLEARYINEIEQLDSCLRGLRIIKDNLDLVASAATAALVEMSSEVFVVHGHDNEAKQTVARFIEKLSLEATILHEKPDSGKTTIEKFEQHANVGFAVVLLTPDDKGYSVQEGPEKVRARARQNVVLELGYFVAKLGRDRVCALMKGDIEVPSDYLGVLYVPFNPSNEDWKMKLFQNLQAAGFPVDANKMV